MAEISLPQGGTSSDRFLRRLREGLLSSIRHPRKGNSRRLVSHDHSHRRCLPTYGGNQDILAFCWAQCAWRPASLHHGRVASPVHTATLRCTHRHGPVHLRANVKIYQLFREHSQKSRLIYFSLRKFENYPEKRQHEPTNFNKLVDCQHDRF